MKKTSFFSRNAFRIFLAAVFLLPIALRGARFAVEGTKNDVKEWLPDGFKETAELRWFRQYFMGDSFVVMSWKGCQLDDPRVEQLAEKLEHPDPQHAAAVHRYIKKVTTGPRVLAQMTDPDGKLKLSREEALRRLDGSLVGRDGKTTCILVTLTNESLGEFRKVLGRARPLTQILMKRENGLLWKVAEDVGIPNADLIMGGPPVDNVAIDDQGEITLLRLVGLSGLLGLCLSYYCFRSKSVTAMVFCCGVYGAAASLAIVYLTGGTCDAVLMSMPSLIYVLGLSGAIHLVNYYKDAVREAGEAGAPEKAVRHGWLPCTLAALTTALGLGSLIMSEIIPIRKFGRYSALGVMFTLAILFALLPAFLELWPPRAKPKTKKNKKKKDTRPDGPEAIATPHGKWSDRLLATGDWIASHHALVAVGCTLVMLTLAIGISKIKTSVHLLKLFDEHVDIIQDYTWLEEHLGNLVPMEVVLRVQPDRMRDGDEAVLTAEGRYRMTFLERMEMTRKVQENIERLPEVDRALSMVTFAPELPEETAGFSAFAERSAYNAKLSEHREDFLNEDYFRDGEGGEELFRISARLAALSDVDYGQFVDQIRASVEPVMAAYLARDEIVSRIACDDRSLAGKRVCVIGVPRDDAVDTATTEAAVVAPAAQLETKAATLVELLRVAGVRVTAVPKAAADYVAMNIVTAGAKNRKLAAYFGKFDLVYVAADHPSIAHGFIEKHAKQLVDGRHIDTLLASQDADTKAGFAPVYTGVVPLVYKAQRTLLSGLVNSIAMAFVLICIVMIAILRSPAAGLLSMLPNIFPVLIIFGSMGWLGIYVDIGTMMCASVALGVAVDDTVHFLTWFRRGILEGLDRRGAVHMAYERCASAMIQTTVIGGFGLAVFAFSTFNPTQRFGILMLVLLATALVGDLVFLPALLSGPIGKFFTKRLKSQAEMRQRKQAEAAARIPSPHFAAEPVRVVSKTVAAPSSVLDSYTQNDDESRAQ